nr:low-density lipoprotein receptor-related protein 8-like [Cavia porcellus]
MSRRERGALEPQLLVLLLVLQHLAAAADPAHGGQGPVKACEKDQFQCRNKRCIPLVWRCDEDDDCSDNSDEDDCPKRTCVDSDFTCDSGHCIPGRWKCDGEEECPDGSDESETTCSESSPAVGAVWAWAWIWTSVSSLAPPCWLGRPQQSDEQMLLHAWGGGVLVNSQGHMVAS